MSENKVASDEIAVALHSEILCRTWLTGEIDAAGNVRIFLSTREGDELDLDELVAEANRMKRELREVTNG